MKEEARVNPLGCVSCHQANQTRQEHVHPHGSFRLEEAREKRGRKSYESRMVKSSPSQGEGRQESRDARAMD
jgi:hypothetical protein